MQTFTAKKLLVITDLGISYASNNQCKVLADCDPP